MQSIIALTGRSDIEVVVDEDNTLDMGCNEGVMAQEELKDNDLGRAGGGEAPFMSEIGDIRLSVALVVDESSLSSFLKMIHSSIFPFDTFKKGVRSFNDCEKIAAHRVERSTLESGFE